MPSRLILHPTAAAAAQALAAAPGGAVVAGDSQRGFFAFALEMAQRHRPFRLPVAAERLVLALAAADRAGLDLPASAARALAVSLSELHGSGLTPPQLRNLPAAGLAAALEAHRRILAARGLVDAGDIPWLASDAVSAVGFEAIEVAPKASWTQGELAWIEALGRRCQVTVRLPEDSLQSELFAPLDPVHQELARSARVTLAPPDQDWGGVLARARGVQSPAIQACSYGSVEDEARGVARQVRSLLRAGVAPDALAVTSLESTSPELVAALEAAGVPVGAPALPLTATAAAQAALAILAAAEEGLPRERLCELLLTRLLHVREATRWVRHLREAGCGSHREQRLLPQLGAFLARKPELSHEGLAALQAAIAAIAALPDQAPVEDHARRLWWILSQLGIVERFARPSADKRLEPARQLGLFESTATEDRGFQAGWVEVARVEGLAALGQVREILDSLAKLAKSGRVFTQADFAGLFRDALAATSAWRAPPLPGGVTVGTSAALAGRSYSHVFLMGLSGDGGAAPEDSLLPETLRRAARDLCDRPALLPAVGAQTSGARQRMALALAAGLATEGLWASGSRSLQGKPAEPSPLLAEIARSAVAGIRQQPLCPWPSGGRAALTRDELCAAVPDEPAVMEAEPHRAGLYAGFRAQRVARERAILERRIDAYGGDLTAPDLAPELAARLVFDGARRLTASTLESLAGCGFRAFGEVLLKLKTPDERDESLDRRDRGTLMHKCLERGLLALKASKLLPLGGDLRQAASQRQVFLEAVRSELGDRERAGEGGHPTVWKAQRRGIERELLRVLEEGQRSEDGFVPTEVELDFGQDRPSAALSVEGELVQLGGRLDRLDVGPGGRLRVVDYKSGGLPLRDKRLLREFAGRDLQLGHYALLFKLTQPSAAVDAVYYSIRDAGFSWSLGEACARAGVTLEAFLDADPAARDEARRRGMPNLPNLIEAHLSRARAGQFPVSPGDCGYCEFAAGCRVGGLYEEWD